MSDRRDPNQPSRRKATRDGGRRADGPPADWLSITAYAQAYGVDRSTVHKWLRSHLLDVYRVGALVRIRNLPPDQHVAPQKSSGSV